MSYQKERLQQNIPPGPQGAPIIGSLPDFQKDSLNFLLNLRREYGDVVRFRVSTWSSCGTTTNENFVTTQRYFHGFTFTKLGICNTTVLGSFATCYRD